MFASVIVFPGNYQYFAAGWQWFICFNSEMTLLVYIYIYIVSCSLPIIIDDNIPTYLILMIPISLKNCGEFLPATFKVSAVMLSILLHMLMLVMYYVVLRTRGESILFSLPSLVKLVSIQNTNQTDTRDFYELFYDGNINFNMDSIPLKQSITITR